jgi:hypothetical protein
MEKELNNIFKLSTRRSDMIKTVFGFSKAEGERLKDLTEIQIPPHVLIL